MLLGVQIGGEVGQRTEKAEQQIVESVQKGRQDRKNAWQNSEQKIMKIQKKGLEERRTG